MFSEINRDQVASSTIGTYLNEKSESSGESGNNFNSGTVALNAAEYSVPPPLDNLQSIDIIQANREFLGSTFGKKATTRNLLTPPKATHSRSAENLKRRNKFGESTGNSAQVPNLYLDVNEYKTFFGDESPAGTTETKHVEPKYTWEYDSDTLKALNSVTKKFDSFRMRQLRAKYFYAAVDSAIESEEKKISSGKVGIVSSGNNANNVDQVSCQAADKTLQKKYLSKNLSSEVSSNSPEIQSQSLTLSLEETERIEFFYSSLDCETFVAGCMADILASIKGADCLNADGPIYRWVQVWVGVPVLLFNVGNDKRKPRKLTIVIAQRDTGLTLWSETVTYATDYKQIENEGLHLLNEGGSGKRALKIRWSDWDCARAFMEKFKQLTSNKNDPLWLQSGSKQPKLIKSKSKKIFKRRDIKNYRPENFNANVECQNLAPLESNSSSGNRRFSELIRKKDISLPVNARIVTRVDSKDINFRTTFAGLLPMPSKTWRTHPQDEEFRPRLPTN